jgi:N-carbamoyl-L-amino-acid hydrolase
MTTNIQISSQRLWDSLMVMAKIGATPDGGVRRLSLTDEDRQARDLFARWCRESGLDVLVDRFGNTFGRRQGVEDRPPVIAGSHLDTQPSGGKFDGAYGVLAALEVLRTLQDANIETQRAVEVVNWTNEEGAIFKPMIGSAVFTGMVSLEEAYRLTDPSVGELKAGLQRIGYIGDRPFFPQRVHAYFEAHIEQGPVLEKAGCQVGVVTGAIAQRWYDVALQGQELHAGPVPMELRRDAMAGAADITREVRQIAIKHSGRATVGWLRLEPGSRNVVPGRAEMTVDLRHAEDRILTSMDIELREAIRRIAGEHGLGADVSQLVHIQEIRFDPVLVGYVRNATRRLGVSHMDIVSGAGHDACNLAKFVPATMIFVPCAEGISHNPHESANPDDLAAGCQVLLQVVVQAANAPGAAGSQQ